MEKRNSKEHNSEEAKGSATAGISSFKKIFEGYQHYLVKEKNKDVEPKEK